MDLSADIIYRGFSLNNPALNAPLSSGGIAEAVSGCTVDEATLSDVDVVQYVEKRALADGVDVGPVFLGQRRISLAGTIYGQTRALLFDAIRDLRAALSPTLAYGEVPGDFGYESLYFSEPTNDAAYSGGSIALQVLAMPRPPKITIFRQKQGGGDGSALAATWQCQFVCRDPRIFSAVPVTVAFTDTVSGTVTNRGDYPSPLNALIAVGTAGGSLQFNIAGSIMLIGVPASTNPRTIRYKGRDKVLTLEEVGVETPRMDLLTFSSGTTHPLIPGGDSPYSITNSGLVLSDGTEFWFDESYAG